MAPLRLCYMHHWQCVAQTGLNGRFWNPAGWLTHAERHLRAIFCINCEAYKVNISELLPSAIVSGLQLCLRYFSSGIHRQKKSSLLFSPLLFLLPWGVCSASWHISQRSCVRPSPAWIGEHTAVSCKKQNDGVTRIYHNFLNTMSARVQVAFSFPVCFLNTKLQVNTPISGPPTLFFAADLWE